MELGRLKFWPFYPEKKHPVVLITKELVWKLLWLYHPIKAY
jgi:hypothetical protein